MKMKLILLPLAIFNLVVVGCSNEQKSKEVVTKELNWFSPTKEENTLRKAKKICQDNGGRLPTIDELKSVIIECGGTPDYSKVSGELYEENIANKAYIDCYEKKGFVSNYYWSLTPVPEDKEKVWIVAFYGGSIFGNDISFDKSYINCVKND